MGPLDSGCDIDTTSLHDQDLRVGLMLVDRAVCLGTLQTPAQGIDKGIVTLTA